MVYSKIHISYRVF